MLQLNREDDRFKASKKIRDHMILCDTCLHELITDDPTMQITEICASIIQYISQCFSQREQEADKSERAAVNRNALRIEKIMREQSRIGWEDKTLPVHLTDFKEFVTKYSEYYIDKTTLIKEILLQRSKLRMVMVTRPSGWGKSLNMSMLKYFLKAQVDDNGLLEQSKSHLKLFVGGSYQTMENNQLVTYNLKPLKVTKARVGGYRQITRQVQGQHPVIFMDFSHIKSVNSNSLKVELIELLVAVFAEHQYLENTKAAYRYRNALLQLKKLPYDLIKLRIAGLGKFLKDLAEALELHHHRTCYVLIDSYDYPVLKSLSLQPLDEIRKISKLILSMIEEWKNAGKNELKVIVTGKCDIFSTYMSQQDSINHSVADPNLYQEYGFIQEELRSLIHSFMHTAVVESKPKLEFWREKFNQMSFFDEYYKKCKGDVIQNKSHSNGKRDRVIELNTLHQNSEDCITSAQQKIIQNALVEIIVEWYGGYQQQLGHLRFSKKINPLSAMRYLQECSQATPGCQLPAPKPYWSDHTDMMFVKQLPKHMRISQLLTYMLQQPVYIQVRISNFMNHANQQYRQEDMIHWLYCAGFLTGSYLPLEDNYILQPHVPNYDTLYKLRGLVLSYFPEYSVCEQTVPASNFIECSPPQLSQIINCMLRDLKWGEQMNSMLLQALINYRITLGQQNYRYCMLRDINCCRFTDPQLSASQAKSKGKYQNKRNPRKVKTYYEDSSLLWSELSEGCEYIDNIFINRNDDSTIYILQVRYIQESDRQFRSMQSILLQFLRQIFERKPSNSLSRVCALLTNDPESLLINSHTHHYQIVLKIIFVSYDPTISQFETINPIINYHCGEAVSRPCTEQSLKLSVMDIKNIQQILRRRKDKESIETVNEFLGCIYRILGQQQGVLENSVDIYACGLSKTKHNAYRYDHFKDDSGGSQWNHTGQRSSQQAVKLRDQQNSGRDESSLPVDWGMTSEDNSHPELKQQNDAEKYNAVRMHQSLSQLPQSHSVNRMAGKAYYKLKSQNNSFPGKRVKDRKYEQRPNETITKIQSQSSHLTTEYSYQRSSQLLSTQTYRKPGGTHKRKAQQQVDGDKRVPRVKKIQKTGKNNTKLQSEVYDIFDDEFDM